MCHSEDKHVFGETQLYCIPPIYLLCIPPISKMCANSYFERSFSYAAPFLWNRLDMSIRMLDFDHFKSRIKTELYLRYFEA